MSNMKRPVYVIQGKYAQEYGWEDLSEYCRPDYATDSDARAACLADLKEYRLAEPSSAHRMITRREEVEEQEAMDNE